MHLDNGGEVLQRELIGVCKAGLLQVRQQLQQYVQQLHAADSVGLNPIMQQALNEVTDVFPDYMDTLNGVSYTDEPAALNTRPVLSGLISQYQTTDVNDNEIPATDQDVDNDENQQTSTIASNSILAKLLSRSRPPEEDEMTAGLNNDHPDGSGFETDNFSIAQMKEEIGTGDENDIMLVHHQGPSGLEISQAPASPSNLPNHSRKRKISTPKRRMMSESPGPSSSPLDPISPSSVASPVDATDAQLMESAEYRDERWWCPVEGCSLSYASLRPALRRHIRTVHTGTAPPTQCPYCSYTTRRPDNLRTHILTHEKPKRSKSSLGQLLTAENSVASPPTMVLDGPTLDNILGPLGLDRSAQQQQHRQQQQDQVQQQQQQQQQQQSNNGAPGDLRSLLSR